MTKTIALSHNALTIDSITRYAQFITIMALCLAIACARLTAVEKQYHDGLAQAYALSNAFANVSEQVSPAVVHIKVRGTTEETSQLHPQLPPWFMPRQPRSQPRQGQGSGVIISAEGAILTNHHVIEGANSIVVVMNDGRELDAKVIGSDPGSDLALVQLPTTDESYPHAHLGNSDHLRPGEWVIAMGSPFGLQHSITAGIVSAVGRKGLDITNYENFIQTDAAINPGNSGGPLINLAGEVIGINTAIFSRSGGNMGIGFAIPIDFAKPIIGQLQEHGSVRRGFLGVMIQDLNKELAESLGVNRSDGALISQVMKDGPAERAGLEAGDVVEAVNGVVVTDANELKHEIAAIAPGNDCRLTILRGERTMTLVAQLDLRPGSPSTASSVNASSEWGLMLEQREDQGVVIAQVLPNSPAQQAGLEAGMILLKVGRETIKTTQQAHMAFSSDNDRIAILIDDGQGATYRIMKK